MEKPTIDQIKSNLHPNQHWIVDNAIIIHVGGSRLYGTNHERSDWDIRGITVPPDDYIIGALSFDQWEQRVPELNFECVIYDYRKWLRLAAASNPNVMETAFVDIHNDNVILWTEKWHDLKKKLAPIFDQRAFTAYHGYAVSQLKKTAIKQSNKTGRTELAEKFGIDTKFVSHCIRLCRQGAEFLINKTITFPRPDAEYLKEIRNGTLGLTFDQYIQLMESEIKSLKQAKEQTALPIKGDFNHLNALFKEIFLSYYG